MMIELILKLMHMKIVMMRKLIDIDNGDIGRYKARDENSNSNGVNGGKDRGKVDNVHIDDNANANYDIDDVKSANKCDI